MKYKKCPRCGLNWIAQTELYCKVCLDELNGVKSIFDDDVADNLCPFCNKNPLVGDESMCEECRREME